MKEIRDLKESEKKFGECACCAEKIGGIIRTQERMRILDILHFLLPEETYRMVAERVLSDPGKGENDGE